MDKVHRKQNKIHVVFLLCTVVSYVGLMCKQVLILNGTAKVSRLSLTNYLAIRKKKFLAKGCVRVLCTIPFSLKK